MLEGYAKYFDKSNKEYAGTGKTYEFNLSAAEFPNVLWMSLSTTVGATEELFDVNKLLFTATKENKSMGEDIFYEASGSCRIDVAATIKTNALNMNFAARIGSAVRYALGIPAREVLNDMGDMLAEEKIGVGQYVFRVKYHCSVPTELYAYMLEPSSVKLRCMHLINMRYFLNFKKRTYMEIVLV